MPVGRGTGLTGGDLAISETSHQLWPCFPCHLGGQRDQNRKKNVSHRLGTKNCSPIIFFWGGLQNGALVKTPVAEPDDPNLSPRTWMVEGENWLPCVVFWFSHVYAHTCICSNKNEKGKKRSINAFFSLLLDFFFLLWHWLDTNILFRLASTQASP